jgi:putative transposase
MSCPHCASTETAERAKKTVMGYRMFWCCQCARTFNERTGTAFTSLEYPPDIVLLVVLWRLRYKLSLRDVAEMFLERGFAFTRRARSRVGSPFCRTYGRSTACEATRASKPILVRR